MSDSLEESVETFLSDADTIFGEYDQGYMDADAALSLLRDDIETLDEEFDE